MHGDFLGRLGLATAFALVAGVAGFSGSVYADEEDVSAASVDEMGGMQQSADLNTQATTTGFIQVADDMDYGDGSLANSFSFSGDTNTSTGGTSTEGPATGGAEAGIPAGTVDELGVQQQSADLNTQATTTGFIQTSDDSDYGDGSLVMG